MVPYRDPIVFPIDNNNASKSVQKPAYTLPDLSSISSSKAPVPGGDTGSGEVDWSRLNKTPPQKRGSG